jgi:hypothetical protein
MKRLSRDIYFLFFLPSRETLPAGLMCFPWFYPRKYTMKKLLIFAVLMFSMETALSAAKQYLDTYTALINNRHAQIEALTSN